MAVLDIHRETLQDAVIRIARLPLEQRLKRKDFIINVQRNTTKSNQELLALKIVALRGKWLAVDDPRLRCEETRKLGRPYRRVTIAALLEFAWVDGVLRWVAEYTHECEHCLESKKGCRSWIHLVDADGSESSTGFSHTGYDDVAVDADVPRRGLSLEAVPDLDDPAHEDVIFGWSRNEVERYLTGLRHRRKEEAEAERRGQEGGDAYDRGVGQQLDGLGAILGEMEDAAAELTTGVCQQLAIANVQGQLAHAASHVDTIKRALFERTVSIVRANALLPLCSTTTRPTSAIVVLTDSTTHAEMVARLRDAIVPDGEVPEHFRARPLPAPGLALVQDGDRDRDEDRSEGPVDSRETSRTVQ